MFKYGLALCGFANRTQEGLEIIQRSEKLFHELCDEMENPQDYDLLFHLLQVVQDDLTN